MSPAVILILLLFGLAAGSSGLILIWAALLRLIERLRLDVKRCEVQEHIKRRLTLRDELEQLFEAPSYEREKTR